MDSLDCRDTLRIFVGEMRDMVSKDSVERDCDLDCLHGSLKDHVTGIITT